jgi:hypothetical protein
MIDRLMIGDFIDFSPFRSDFTHKFRATVQAASGFNPISRRLMAASILPSDDRHGGAALPSALLHIGAEGEPQFQRWVSRCTRRAHEAF